MFAVIPLLLLAYIIGSLMSAVIVSRLLHLPDPRLSGSGNPGATNVLRTAGKKAAALTFLGDFLKGLLPVWFIQQLLTAPVITMLLGIALLLGHIFPVFFHFKGGKGVATALGILLGMAWPIGLASFSIWLLVVGLTRYVSLGSSVAAISAPLLAYYFRPEYSLGITVLAIMIVWRHLGNLQRLCKGEEIRLGKHK